MLGRQILVVGATVLLSDQCGCLLLPIIVTYKLLIFRQTEPVNPPLRDLDPMSSPNPMPTFLPKLLQHQACADVHLPIRLSQELHPSFTLDYLRVSLSSIVGSASSALCG
jgi:hypothetical protein